MLLNIATIKQLIMDYFLNIKKLYAHFVTRLLTLEASSEADRYHRSALKQEG